MAVETVRDRMLQLQAHEIYSRMPFHERLRLSIEEANILINGESQTNPAHKGWARLSPRSRRSAARSSSGRSATAALI